MPSTTTSSELSPTRRASMLPVLSARSWLWFVIVPLAGVLRFFHLGHKSLWLDEAATFSIVTLDWGHFLRFLWMREANMAAFYFTLRPFMHLGQSEWWLRLPAVLAGIATVPVMYALGRRVFGRRAGLLAALLTALNACQLAYSQEARGYSMAVLFVAVSCLLFMQGIERPAPMTWLWFGVVSALAVYSHFYAALVLAAEWTSLLALQPRKVPWKHLLAGSLLTLILIIPAIAVIVDHDVGQLAWVPKANWMEGYHLAVFLAANGEKAVGGVLLALDLIALVLAARQFPREADEPAQSLDRWRHFLLWCWLLVPIGVTLAGSLHTPMFFHRFLIVCLPAFLLLVAGGLACPSPRRALIAACLLVSAVATVLSYTRVREDWRSATAYVLGRAGPGDAVFFQRDYGMTPFTYYEHRAQATLPHLGVGPSVALPAVNGYRRMWVMLYPLAPPDAEVQASARAATARYRKIEARDFHGIRVILFALDGQ